MTRLLLVGPPGSGKTHAARLIHASLPPLLEWQAVECAWIHHGAKIPQRTSPTCSPFRAPHHTVSQSGLIGTFAPASGVIRPGEVCLAHNGLLFLDELDEFRPDAIAALAMVLEHGSFFGIPCRPLAVIATATDYTPNARTLRMIP